MKQMNIPLDNEKKIQAQWQLFVDGAARNNPGPAGAGIYILKNNDSVVKQGFFLESKTNNQAEYLALVIGICQVSSLMADADHLEIMSDSQLLVRQLAGRYAVKNKMLKILYDRIKQMLISISYTVRHVPRSENVVADHLANKGIDEKIPIPDELVHLCKL